MISEIRKGTDTPKRKITAEDMAEIIAKTVSGMDGVTDKQQTQIKKLFFIDGG